MQGMLKELVQLLKSGLLKNEGKIGEKLCFIIQFRKQNNDLEQQYTLILKNMNIKTNFIAIFAISLAYSQIIASSAQCCSDNTIKVSGTGTVSGLPDMATIQLHFNEKGQTSAQAVQAINTKVNQVVSILNGNGYTSSQYTTSSLNVYPQYNYLNGKTQIVGQQAQQSLTITILGVDAKGQKVGTLVDALSQVNGINLDSVSFDVYNKTSLQNQARATAFRDAKTKASDYVSFAGLNLGRVLKIDDSFRVQSPATPLAFKAVSLISAADSTTTTQIPIANLDITYSTVVTFSLQ